MHRHALLALLMCFGCRADRVSAAPVDQSSDPESPPKSMPMAEHFIQGEALRDALIAGDLGASKAPARWLLDNLTDDDMQAAKTRRAAKKVFEADTLADATAAAGKLAAACGECHAEEKLELTPPERNAPLKDDSTFAQMDRHSYAAERMWDGLVGPVDEAWIEGASLMRDAPLHGDAAPEPVTTLAASVHELATTSLELKPNDRGERYGEIIASCAGCHKLLEG